MTNLKLIGFIIVLILGVGNSHAQPILNDATDHLILGKALEYIEDPESNLALSDILKGKFNWQPGEDHVFNKGFSDSTWWIRFNISNQSNINEWLLVVGYPILDSVNVYEITQFGEVKHWQMGDLLPFEQRPIENRNFIAPLNLATDSSSQFILQVQTNGSLQIPLEIWQPHAFYASDAQLTAIQGAYYGALAVIAIYNFLLLFALKDRTYFYYVGYVIFLIIFSASIGGWGYQYLWPNAFMLNDKILLLSLCIALFFGLSFIKSFLLRYFPKPINDTHNVVIGISVLLTGLALLIPYPTAIRLVVIYAASMGLWGLLIGVYAWKKDITSAKLYTISWGMLLCGVFIIALNKYNIIPKTAITEYAIQIGAVLETVLLSFALAERINAERGKKAIAERKAREAQQALNFKLEEQVLERTQELARANFQLNMLAVTDELTGAYNRRHFNTVCSAALGAQNRKDPLAFCMFDIDYFKRYNDEYGHSAGDDVLVAVSEAVKSTLKRSADSFFRLGGEEFGVLFTAKTPQSAFDFVEEMKEAITALNIPHCKNPHGIVTASFGVTYWDKNTKADIERLYNDTDKALYEAKDSGRNRVKMDSSLGDDIIAGE